MNAWQRWLWVVPLSGGTWAAIRLIDDGVVAAGVAVAMAGIAIAWYLLPWRQGPAWPLGRNGATCMTHQEALASDQAAEGVLIYWRPGCGFCSRLRNRLGDAGDRAIWINIWTDDAAAAYVRSVNDGNETVLTVVIAGTPHTNPDPNLVIDALAGRP